MRILGAFALSLALVACGGSKLKVTSTAAPKKADRTDVAPPAIKAMVEGAAFAKVYLESGDATGAKGKAIAKLEESLVLDERLWEAHYDLGLVHAKAGELGKAEEHLAKAAAMVPDNEAVAVALCEVRRRRGETKPAAEGLEAFVKTHPGALDARARLVVVCREAGRFDDAIGHARYVLARRPLDDGTRAELALAHLAKGERDTAELLAAQALKGNPKSAAAQRAFGLISLQKGDDAEAFRAFEKAAELDPNDTTARVNMGNVLLRAGAFKEAEHAFRQVLGSAPNDEGAMLGLAIALRGQKKLDESRATYEKLLDKSPKHLAATFGLAVLYADHLKDNGKARALFKQVAADAPAGSTMKAEAEKYLKELPDTAPPSKPEPPAPPAKKGKT